MPSKKPTTIWEAAPHTLAKIAILREYLSAYFPIFGRRGNGDILLYIDGFAGPGQYTNLEDGSPTIALKTAIGALQQLGSSWRGGDLRCVFIESELWARDHLVGRLGALPKHPRVHHDVLLGRFAHLIARLTVEYPGHFTGGEPLFAFIDPFGATGAPFRVIQGILSTARSEVLINFDVDGIGRILRATDSAKNASNLTDIFGDEGWREEFSRGGDLLTHSREALNMFKRRLRALPNVRYVFSFEMQKTRGRPDYHLIFASQHPLGLEKMKDAMRTIDREGGYQFCDATVGQGTLFRFDEPGEWARRLHAHFVGRTVGPREVVDYTLNETPFTNAAKMMDVLDDDRLIECTPARKRRSFMPAKVEAVSFLREPRPSAAKPKRGKPTSPGLFDAQND